MMTVIPLADIGEVGPGANLATILSVAMTSAGIVPEAHDILVVTQKIVSKSEDRFVSIGKIEPGTEARRIAAITFKDPKLVELVLSESIEVIRAAPRVLITRHRSGHVMANAGIDQSNIGGGREGQALLLPLDADASAERLRRDLSRLSDHSLAVIISDSFGRPWRHGVINVAIGAAGVPSLWDRRGEQDRDGRILEVTQIAFADAVAAAAGLATGEGAEGIPAVLVRGLNWDAPVNPAAALLRPSAEDLFRS